MTARKGILAPLPRNFIGSVCACPAPSSDKLLVPEVITSTQTHSLTPSWSLSHLKAGACIIHKDNHKYAGSCRRVMERLACIPSKFHALHGAYDFPINFCSMGLASILSHSRGPKAGTALGKVLMLPHGVLLLLKEGNQVEILCHLPVGSPGVVFACPHWLHRQEAQTVLMLTRHSGNSVKINIFKATRTAKWSSCCLHWLHEGPEKASASLGMAGLAASEGRSRLSGSFCRDGDVQTFLSPLPARGTWGSHSPVAWLCKEEGRSQSLEGKNWLCLTLGVGMMFAGQIMKWAQIGTVWDPHRMCYWKYPNSS